MRRDVRLDDDQIVAMVAAYLLVNYSTHTGSPVDQMREAVLDSYKLLEMAKEGRLDG